MIAATYESQKDYDRAITDLGEAIRLDPSNAAYYNSRCWDRALADRDLPQALDDCNRSLQLQPNAANVFNSRGLVQLKLGAFDAAVADYGAAVTRNAKDADSLYGRGAAKLKRGDSAGGNADVIAARAISPNIAEVYAGYGVK